MAINLNFNEEQQMLQDSARDFLQRHVTPALVRKYENSEDELPRAVWKQMAELGWLGMSFPEDYDGLGSSLVDQFALYTELGRALAPTPNLETALSSALIAALGAPAQKKALLPAIAAGEAIVAPALLELDCDYGPDGVALRAVEAGGGGYKLSGVKALVPFAGAAQRLLCPARTGGRGEAGVTLFLVDPAAAGVTRERAPSLSGLPLYMVTLKDAPGELLGPVGGGWKPLQDAAMKAAILQAAMVVGAGERVLEMSVSYAQERVQFGEPIGKYQFVQQLVTEIAIQGHNTRLLALHAAWRADAGLPFLREAALAKAAAAKAMATMTFCAHEVHAGIGFMLDYDLQLYTKRAKYWETSLGDARHHLDRAIAESTGGVAMDAAAGAPRELTPAR